MFGWLEKGKLSIFQRFDLIEGYLKKVFMYFIL